MGASLALPFLDAMAPRAFAAPKAAHRFQTFYVPNGMAMEYWTPKAEGPAFELSPILEPLAPYRDQMLVLSGIKASWNYIHAGASGSFLTGTPKGGKNEIEIFADVSMDQLLARHFADQTQVASLELSMDAPANAGACTGNLSCVYTHTLSWKSATQPLPMEWNPRAVFERLFGDSGSTDRAAREKRLLQHKSILDSVQDKLAGLQRELGPGDRARVGEFTDAATSSGASHAPKSSDIELPTIDAPQARRPCSRIIGADARPAAPRVPSDHARHLVQDRQRTEARPAVSADRVPRRIIRCRINDIPELIARMSKINRYHTALFE
jgi:hypothetical protein